MKTLRFFLSLAVLPIACATVQWAPYSATNETTKFDGHELYLASIRALVRMGYGFASRDENANAIETDYRETVYDPQGCGSRYQISWRIITHGGELSIYASCQHSNRCGFDPSYKDCGNQRPVEIIDEENRLREKILSDVERGNKQETK